MSLKLLVYDDNAGFRAALASHVKRGAKGLDPDMQVLSDKDFTSQLEELASRQREGRAPPAKPPTGKASFDWPDVFLLDFDLRDIPALPLLNGEWVSYFVRCYSNTRLIVSVNPLPKRIFDLRLRSTYTDSWADVSVYAEDLALPGLWRHSDARTLTYRPWYWPHIPTLYENMRQMVSEAAKHMDTPLLDFFDFPVAARNAMPKDLSTASVSEPSTATFRTVAAGRIRKQDVQNLDDARLAKIAASAVHSWLEHVVLPGQHVLVDAPHLVYRYPSLLKGNAKKIAAWNATSNLEIEPSEYLDDRAISNARFKRKAWLSRPVWWASTLSSNSGIAEVKSPWTYTPPTWVFAEDTSRFHEESECEPFLAAGSSAYARRWIRMRKEMAAKEDVQYEPAMRLAASKVA